MTGVWSIWAVAARGIQAACHWSRRADLTDRRVGKLEDELIEAQEREIAGVKGDVAELEGN